MILIIIIIIILLIIIIIIIIIIIQLSFAILRTVPRCVRGSRYPFKSSEVSEDFTLAVAGLHLYL